MSLDLLTRPETYLSLLTLSAMEIVLGIDNIVFVAILSGKLPKDQRESARRLGISLALFMRLGLLFGITWVMSMTRPLFELFGKGFSGRDLILLGGGLFLLFKATHEIHDKLESPMPSRARSKLAAAPSLPSPWLRSWCSTSCSRSTP